LSGIGIDFGTTNSAIAVARAGQVELARFATGGAYRSILHFDPDEKGPDRRPKSVAGPKAIAAYLEGDGSGRLIQSLKSYLASRTFQATSIFTYTYTLEDLASLLLRHLRTDAGELPEKARVVVGRPVRLAGADTPDDETLALGRLRAALARAGFPEISFEYEPVGAAYHYERALDHDELVLVADFGGGTSDFCVVRAGPSVRGRRTPADILGTEGVALAGDSFDRQIVRRLVAPALGKGGKYVIDRKEMPIPPWLYGHLERWHHLSFLKSRETLKLLGDILEGAREPERVEALLHLVDSDLGYALYRAVEKVKIELSHRPSSRLVFIDDPIKIDTELTRADFEGWISEELESIAACVDRLLDKTGIAAKDVDKVFMTGGSSLVPSVRRIFAQRFGEERLASGDELTSVASGLALRAEDAG
jgi:hypothetical chaperone protein